MSREAIAPEGQDHVGLNVDKRVMNASGHIITGYVVEAPVGVSEETLLFHAQVRQRSLQLVLANSCHGPGGTRTPIDETSLAACHVHAHDSVAAANGTGK